MQIKIERFSHDRLTKMVYFFGIDKTLTLRCCRCYEYERDAIGRRFYDGERVLSTPPQDIIDKALEKAKNLIKFVD
jgi:hypothetical protein